MISIMFVLEHLLIPYRYIKRYLFFCSYSTSLLDQFHYNDKRFSSARLALVLLVRLGWFFYAGLLFFISVLFCHGIFIYSLLVFQNIFIFAGTGSQWSS